MPSTISKPTVERLSKYRRYLATAQKQRQTHVYSHELAAELGVTSSLVRRDIMVTGCMGNPSRGYGIDDLMQAISQIVDAEAPDPVILIGLGKLGGALLNYFQGRRPNLRIVAAFDTNLDKVNRLYQGTHCYALDKLEDVVRENHVSTAILAVPGQVAQAVTDQVVVAGIAGILNFAPVRLHVPANVYVESIDLTTILEKTNFYARQTARQIV